MSRPGTDSQALQSAASAPAGRADNAIRAAAGATVAGLADIAGAISYSHMRELAAAHGEAGWQGTPSRSPWPQSVALGCPVPA